MSGKWLRLAGLSSAAALWSTCAHAAPGDATRLEYARSVGAKSCPDREALRNAVSKRLGYDPFFPVARQSIVVEIADVSDGLRARMSLVDEQGMIVGSRELHERAEHCDELVASLALAISIALDPSAALGGEPSNEKDVSSERSAPAVATEALPSAPEATQVVKPPQRAPRVRTPPAAGTDQASSGPFGVRGGAFVASGVAPGLAWGLRGGVSARWAWFQMIAELADQFPAERTVSNGTVRASLTEATLAPCLVRTWLAGCGVLNVGVLASAGRDVDSPVTNKALYASVGARLEVSPQLVGHLRLLFNADVLKSLTPVTLRLHGEQAWKTPFASVVLGAGFALQFP